MRQAYNPHLNQFLRRLGPFLALLLLLFTPGPGFANWRTYTTADKLLSNNIQALAYRADPLDFPPCDRDTTPNCPSIPGLWVGTDLGVMYLNGRSAVPFVDKLPSSNVHALLFEPEPSSRLWIATDEGVIWLDDKRTPEDSRDDVWSEPYVSDRQVLALTRTADGRVWAGTDHGLIAIDPAVDHHQTYLRGIRITALPRCPLQVANCQVGQNDVLWLGTSDGLYRFDLTNPSAQPERVDATALPSQQITALTLSEDGLWVGTNNGAIKWDGTQWQHHFNGIGNLASPDVRAIDIDDRGWVWFATNAGASRWNPKQNTWRRFFSFRDPIVSNQVQSLLVDRGGTAWMGTAQGLSGNDGSWEMLNTATMYNNGSGLLPSGVTTISIASSTGQIWAGASDGGVTVFDRDLRHLVTLTTENSRLLDNDVSEFVFDPDTKRMWVGTHGGGVAVINDQLNVEKIFATERGNLPGDSVRALTLDPQNQRMWVGTTRGVAVINDQLNVEKTFSTELGNLPSDSVHALTLDAQNQRMWVGTARSVAVINDQLNVEKTFSTKQANLPGDFVRTLTLDPQNQRMWVGTTRSVAVINDQLNVEKTFSTELGNLPSDFVRTLTLDPQNQRMWVGTARGVAVINDQLNVEKTFSTELGNLPGDSVHALTLDPQNQRMWVGTTRGVAVINDQLSVEKTFSTELGNLPGDSVHALTLDPQNQRMWVGTTRGVAVINDQLNVEKTFSTELGNLPGDFVRALTLDPQNQRMWVGTTWGVAVINDQLSVEKTFSTELGNLPSDSVRTLTLDPQNQRMWVETTRGVAVINDQLNVEKTFSTELGNLPGDFVLALILDDQNQRMWVGTYGGGVAVINDQLNVEKTFSTELGNLPSDSVHALTLDPQNQRMWVGTYGGSVAVINDQLNVEKTFSTELGNLPGGLVRALILDDHNQRMWVGTARGVAVINDQLSVEKTFSTELGNLPSDSVRALTLDPQNQRMWVGTTRGVAVINDQLNVEKTFSTELGNLPGDIVRALTLDPQNQRMWVGTTRGVAVINDQLNVEKTFSTKQRNLPSDSVRALTLDPQNQRMWVGAARGVAVINDQLNVEKTFSSELGNLPGDSVQALTRDDQNQRMWVGTTRGVAVIDNQLNVEAILTSANESLHDSTVQTIYPDPQTHLIWVGMSSDAGLLLFEPRGLAPWSKFSKTTEDILSKEKLLDKSDIELFFEGGSLIVPPLELHYRLSLEEVDRDEKVAEHRSQPGVGLGQATFGRSKPLENKSYRLQMMISGSDLKSQTLPEIQFDIQVRPIVTLTHVGDIALNDLSDETIFPSENPLSITWQVQDADAEPDETRSAQYTWNYTADANTTVWLEPLENTRNESLIEPFEISRGGANVSSNLAFRIIDADGNPSLPRIVPLTLQAPPSYMQRLAPFIGGAVIALSLLGLGLVTLSRTSGLPLRLLVRQGITQWGPVGTGYRRYRSQWLTLTPLERLILLVAPLDHAFPAGQLQQLLTHLKTPVAPERLDAALDQLARQQLLHDEHGCYRCTEPGLTRALQQHEGEAGVSHLAGRVRAEHPLFAEFRRFIEAAGFSVSDLADDPLAFLCQPGISTWQQRFPAPVYARLFPDVPLTLQDVADLYQMAEARLDQTQVLFAVVDQTPEDAGWIEIAAIKAQYNTQIVPIDDAVIKRGREQQRERQALEAHLRRFLGRQRDLYNVRDPVADRLSFFGREALAAELLEAIGESQPIALFGLRKMGKSSLLQYLRDRTPFPAAYVDLQSGTDLPHLYGSILNSLKGSLRLKAADVTWEPSALSGRDPSASFTAMIHALMEQLQQSGHAPQLGIFVDEIECIVPQAQSGQMNAEALANYLAFARALRGLVQETGYLSLLVVGVDPLLNRENRFAGQQNPFYQFFREEYLGPLNRDDCIQMVRNIGRQMGLVYSDEAVEFIAQVSGGHPFLARQLCSTAYRAGDQAAGEITLIRLKDAAELFVSEPSTSALLDERGLWGEVTNKTLWPQPQIDENEALLTSLADQAEQSKEELLTAAHQQPVRERSLFELEQRAVLGRLEKLLYIRFGLFRNWIRRYKL